MKLQIVVVSAVVVILEIEQGVDEEEGNDEEPRAFWLCSENGRATAKTTS